MQKLQESVFSIVKTTSLSPAVFSFLQPTEDFTDKTLPLGGILRDTKYGWLALGPKFCVVDLRSGLKVAARTFGNGVTNCLNVTSVVELPTPLTDNSQQLIISLELDGREGLICVFHINGSQLLRCIKTDIVITELAVCDDVPSGPLMCFDGLVMAGTCRGEILVFDLNRTSLIQASKDISQGCEDLVRNEENPSNIIYLPLKALHKIERHRKLAIEKDDHIGLLLNEDSYTERDYILRDPDGTVQMQALQHEVNVTVLQYIPQLGSLAVGFNFGAFQIWNMLNLELEFTSEFRIDGAPVTHFGFQEPCDDPRAFCYLWVVFSESDRFVRNEGNPLAVMHSLTYQGKRMLTETKSLYQNFLMATIRFQVELCAIEDVSQFIGGRCLSCHSYSISSTLGEEGEDTMLNLCQLVWECWGATSACTQYGMLLFDLDQWYKDQMPATYELESNAFMSVARCPEISRGGCLTLDLRLDPASVSPYSHATRLEEHFYPNSLQYNYVCLNTSETSTIHTVGVQRQILRSMCAAGPSCLLNPARLHAMCRAAGLAPLYCNVHATYAPTPEEQRHFLLSVALEARLSRFLKRCAHDWATGTHSGVGCTLTFLVDWCWKRAIELKENAKELTAPLFTSSTLPDRNVVRCLEHCVQQLTALTGLLDAVLTKCCNLVVPDALSEMEEKYKGIGTVSLYFQVVQWFVRVGLLPERLHSYEALPYPAAQLYATYKKRRLKLHRLQDQSDEESENKSCPLLYIDQLIEHEFGGERVHTMWIKGGSECGGLYPPPSLYALLRLYLLPDIALEHKHSLLLYLLLDYSMLYDEMRYEAVIRRLMQFPTMFGLSNTAIKATQAFWHLDHRDFDFALDQLQCLTGNTLSDWQHHVVLSSLLAQKKTQAALQYLHVKKPPPIQNMKDGEDNVNEHYKLEDWQSCCNLYLARGLVFEALDVIRMCVRNADSVDDKAHLLNFFYKGCRNTGQLSKVLQVTLLPFEEEVFVNYLQDCNESQTSELLVMYYLQQARYLEAEQYNSKIKSKGRPKDMATSAESILDVLDRESARDTLVEVLCSALPTIATTVARVALTNFDTHITKPKPMSVYVQATSPKNTFTYKSSFIQDTIENASETWINKPRLRKGMKRALNIQDTPFICTPKTYKIRSLLTSEQRGSETTPPKRAKLDLTGTPRTPKMHCSLKVSDALSQQMASLLDMPEVQTPQKYYDRSGADTPQSILKNRRLDDRDRDVSSPADSRYLCDTDEEELETASNHTHYSDSTNKHLRFTIPTASEGESTPSPIAIPVKREPRETEDESERGGRSDSYKSTMSGVHPMESPPKKFAAEEVRPKKSYKDTVRARISLSISANSSLSDDPSTSIESIADIPVTLFNPRYSAEKKRLSLSDYDDQNRTETESDIKQEREESEMEIEEESVACSKVTLVPRTPTCRRSIRSGVGENIPLKNRSCSGTPERMDSPVVLTPLRPLRATRTRSRSRTPELSPRSSPLPPILEQPKQELESEPHPKATTLSAPRQMRSRSRTPDRQEKLYKESPRLEAIKESPTKSTESPPASPSRRNLRSRSRTPEVTIVSEQPAPSPRSLRSRSRTPEVTVIPEQVPSSPRSLRSRSRTPERMAEQKDVASPRSLRSRSRTPETEIISESEAVKSSRSLRAKTPEKLMSPKKEHISRSRKSLTRIVLEANTFAKTKQLESMDTGTIEEETNVEENIEAAMECTPMKSSKEIPSLIDITFSPITNKSVLQSSSDSLSVTTAKEATDDNPAIKPLPTFTINETYMEKSVLFSYESSVADNSNIQEENAEIVTKSDIKLPDFATIDEDFGKSVLRSVESSIAESSNENINLQVKENVGDGPQIIENLEGISSTTFKLNDTELGKSVLASCESSVAENEDSTNKVNRNRGETFKDGSSIMTSDSEVETKDNWKSQMETKARVIQREKESIVEIEREINEIEGEMSDDCRVETDSGDGEIEEEEQQDEDEDSSESNGEDSEEEEESEEDDDDDDDEIISIEDSDESSDKDRLQIDEPSSDVPTESILVQEFELVEHVVNAPIELDQTSTESGKIKDIVIKPYEIEEIATESEQMEEPTSTENIDVKNVIAMEIEDENIQTFMESESVVEDSSINQLDQAQMLSMLTDDNSAVDTDQSNLNYSEGHKLDEVDVIVRGDEPTEIEPNIVTESEIVDQTDAPIEPDQTHTEPDLIKDVAIKPDEIKIIATESEPMEELPTVDVDLKNVIGTKIEDENDKIKKIATESEPMEELPTVDIDLKNVIGTEIEDGNIQTVLESESVVEDSSINQLDQAQMSMLTDDNSAVDTDQSNLNYSGGIKVEEADRKNRGDKPIEINQPKRSPELIVEITPLDITEIILKKSVLAKDFDRFETSAAAKHALSPSNKPSHKEETKTKTKTPTRKRTQSTPALKSEADKTPENEVSTPTSRRRSKTPTSTEVRRILTRRASKELGENVSMVEEEALTPRRRSTRSRSNDNTSATGDTTVKPSRSTASEDAGDVKSVRKRRPSLKPELTVIPEVTSEESNLETLEEICSDYANARRMTRHQKKALDSLLETRSPRGPRRRASAASREADDDAASTHSAQEEGSVDTDESRASPDSTSTVRPRARLARAASETKASPKPVRATRRMSVDIATVVESASPASASRGRRASFARACEALHTPKGRRTSTDTRSQQGSPASEAEAPSTPVTPGRRTRRSSTSQK
ncbi:uro-adherence factor A-like isoform X3 [Maniola hyperantus]|uniref:uro-adherence factor A-like isoform X3 n=1 Tax=Aphantopus hyperantus TaxID=2795564 RepID=UPI003747C780